MFKKIGSRALVVAAVTGGAFLLGRALSHSATLEPILGNTSCCISALALVESRMSCTAECRRSSNPALDTLELRPEDTTTERVLTSEQTDAVASLPVEVPASEPKESTPTPRGNDVIVIPPATPETAPAPGLDVLDTALLDIPNFESASTTAPSFMPYVEDEKVVTTAERNFLEELFFNWLGTNKTAGADVTPPATPTRDVAKYEPLFPKSDSDNVPARTKADTTEFRPSDARRGDFAPQPF